MYDDDNSNDTYGVYNVVLSANYLSELIMTGY